MENEIDAVLEKNKNKKSASLDEMPSEIRKTRKFDNILLRLCNAINKTQRKEQKKDDHGIAKNYKGITLIAEAAKIYNDLLPNCIWSEIEEVLRKNQNGFRKNQSTTLQILTNRRIIVDACTKISRKHYCS